MIVRLYDAKRMQSSTALAFKVEDHEVELTLRKEGNVVWDQYEKD